MNMGNQLQYSPTSEAGSMNFRFSPTPCSSEFQSQTTSSSSSNYAYPDIPQQPQQSFLPEHLRPGSNSRFNSPSLNPGFIPPVSYAGSPSMPTSEMLGGPLYVSLFQQMQQNTYYLRNMSHQIEQLNQEVGQLRRAQNEARPQVVSSNNEMLQVPAGIRTREPSPSFAVPSPRALDSNPPALQTAIQRSALLPEDCVFEVLWNWKEFLQCENVRLSSGNESRPPLDMVLRHKDGKTALPSIFKAVKASANRITRELVALPPHSDSYIARRPKTKTWFKDHRPKEWSNALFQLEEEQPLLALCSDNWKAQQFIGASLNYLTEKEKTKSGQQARSKGGSGSRKRPSTTSESTDDSDSDAAHNNNSKRNKTSHPPVASSGSNVDMRGCESPAPDGPHMLPPQAVVARKNMPSVASFPRPLPKVPQAVVVVTSPSEKNEVGLTPGASHAEPAGGSASDDDVEPSCNNLIRVIAQEHPALEDIASKLFTALQDNPAFGNGSPSQNFSEFLKRIETAIPSVETYDEDNMGQSWGHHQFNQGSLTCNSAIDSWESVGGPQNACRLVAAAIKTCRVARYLCQDTHPRPTSFVADVYLERVLDILWYQYKAATGSPYTSQTISRTPASTGSLSQTHTDTNSGSAKNNTTPDLPSESCANPSGLSQAADASTESQIAEQPKVPRASQTLEARLELLKVADLKELMKTHSISMPPTGPKNKRDLIRMVYEYCESQSATGSGDVESGINLFIEKRGKRGKGVSS